MSEEAFGHCMCLYYHENYSPSNRNSVPIVPTHRHLGIVSVDKSTKTDILIDVTHSVSILFIFCHLIFLWVRALSFSSAIMIDTYSRCSGYIINFVRLWNYYVELWVNWLNGFSLYCFEAITGLRSLKKILSLSFVQLTVANLTFRLHPLHSLLFGHDLMSSRKRQIFSALSICTFLFPGFSYIVVKQQ